MAVAIYQDAMTAYQKARQEISLFRQAAYSVGLSERPKTDPGVVEQLFNATVHACPADVCHASFAWSRLDPETFTNSKAILTPSLWAARFKSLIWDHPEIFENPNATQADYFLEKLAPVLEQLLPQTPSLDDVKGMIQHLFNKTGGEARIGFLKLLKAREGQVAAKFAPPSSTIASVLGFKCDPEGRLIVDELRLKTIFNCLAIRNVERLLETAPTDALKAQLKQLQHERQKLYLERLTQQADEIDIEDRAAAKTMIDLLHNTERSLIGITREKDLLFGASAFSRIKDLVNIDDQAGHGFSRIIAPLRFTLGLIDLPNIASEDKHEVISWLYKHQQEVMARVPESFKTEITNKLGVCFTRNIELINEIEAAKNARTAHKVALTRVLPAIHAHKSALQSPKPAEALQEATEAAHEETSADMVTLPVVTVAPVAAQNLLTRICNTAIFVLSIARMRHSRLPACLLALAITAATTKFMSPSLPRLVQRAAAFFARSHSS